MCHAQHGNALFEQKLDVELAIICQLIYHRHKDLHLPTLHIMQPPSKPPPQKPRGISSYYSR